MRIRYLLLSAFCFCLLCVQLQAKSPTNSDSVECFYELFDYIAIDPISPKNVNDTFIVRAHVPESAKLAITDGEYPLIIAVDIHPDPEGFSVIDRPLNILEEISSEGGEWIWKLKAKESGTYKIGFRIGYIKNNRLRDNCPKSITVNINALPFSTRFWDGIYSNLGLIVTNIVTLFIAIIGWVIALRKRA
jgi:hypothetical protein